MIHDMELQIVTFEQAKTLRELGFPFSYEGKHYSLNYPIPMKEWNYIEYNWDELGYIEQEGVLFGGSYIVYEYNSDMAVSAPSLELVAKWLREEKNIQVIVNRKQRPLTKVRYYDYDIFQDGVDEIEIIDVSCEKYEEALSYAIDRAIELIKQTN